MCLNSPVISYRGKCKLYLRKKINKILYKKTKQKTIAHMKIIQEE